MSKFDFCSFYGGYDEFAVSAELYTEEQAMGIFKFEIGGEIGDQPGQWRVSKAWVRHRAGVNEDHDPCVGWWLEYSQHKRSCPVWAFSRR